MLEFWEMLDLWKRLYEQGLQRVCERYDLHKMDVDILLFLANNPTCDTAADIVKRRRLVKSHVSSSLKFLEQQGYIEKQFKEGNHKTMYLHLLDKANEVVQDGRNAQEYFQKSLMKHFTKQELTQMRKFLHCMNENVKEALKEEYHVR